MHRKPTRDELKTHSWIFPPLAAVNSQAVAAAAAAGGSYGLHGTIPHAGGLNLTGVTHHTPDGPDHTAG